MRTFSRLTISCGVALIPLLLTFGLLLFYLRVNPADNTPSWSDEIVYWQEINAFRAVGFQSGYFTFEEIPARISFSHFSTHGPVFTGLMGLAARVTGWGYASFPTYNYVFITLALLVFLMSFQFSGTQYLLLGLLIFSSWAIPLFLPETMQETFHFSIAVVAAAIFYHELSSTDPLPRFQKAVFILFFIVAGLVKVSWGFLLLPFLLLDKSNRSPRDYWISGGTALMMILILFILFGAWSAPYPLNVSQTFLRLFTRSPLEGLQLLAKNTVFNIQRLRAGDPLEIINRYEIILILIALMMVRIGRKSIQNRTTRLMRSLYNWFPFTEPEIVFHLLNLGIIVIVQFVVYDVFDWRDYRVLAPHLLISLLLLIAFNRWRLVSLIIAINLLAFPLFLTTFSDFQGGNTGTFGIAHKSRYELAPDLNNFAQATGGTIVYQDTADTAWCNTLLTDNFYPELLTLPAGIGISVTLDSRTFQRTPQSRYLLFKDETFEPLANRVHTLPLVSTSVGELYLNLDANCD